MHFSSSKLINAHIIQQYDSAMDNIRKTSSVVSTDDDSDVIALLLSDDAKSAKDRVAALQLWYEEEQQRIKRRTEFHIEVIDVLDMIINR